jgi:hypothetical protein
VRGIGAGLSVPVGGAGLFPQVAAGSMGGMGGELGRRTAQRINPSLEPYGEILGSVVGGGAGGFLTAPTQSVARKDIAKALQGKDFDSALANSMAAERTGSKTHTAAEAFPDNSALMSLGEQARSGNLDNALRARTEGRLGDLQGLGKTFMDRIGPEVGIGDVANRTGGAATKILENAKNLRNEGIGNRLMGEAVTPPQVNGIIQDLEFLALQPQRPGQSQAYKDVAQVLKDQYKNPLTKVQDLSFALAELKKRPTNPVGGPQGGVAVGDTDMKIALQTAADQLGMISPNWKDAMKDFRDYSKDVMQPLKEGALGTLADKNPIIAGQTPFSRVTGFMEGNSPREIKQAAGALSRAPEPVNPLDIARALAQQKLKGGSTNPGMDMRGLENSDSQKRFEALLQAGGRKPDEIMAPLATADRLQGFTQRANHFENPEMTGAQALIRPFRTADMWLTGRAGRKYNDEVARLLANPSHENLIELQKIAMFSPEVRQMLTMRGAIPSTIGLEQ